MNLTILSAKRYAIAFLLVISQINFSNAQNVGVNGTGTAPDASAMLDVAANDKGMLVPRLALSSTAVAAPVTAPATSLLVYNTATAGDVTPGYYYWDGVQWVRLLSTQSPDWQLAGNAGTTAGTDFVGTTDAQGLAFKTNNVDRMRIAATDPYVGIGHTTPFAALDIRGTNASTSSLAAYRFSNNGFGPYLDFIKSRGAAINASGAVAANDDLWLLRGYADNGTGYEAAGYMGMEVRNANLASSFSLYLHDGTSPYSRLWINEDGQYRFNYTGSTVGTDYNFYGMTDSDPVDVNIMNYEVGTVTQGARLALVSGIGTKPTHTPVNTGDILGQLTFSGYVANSTHQVTASIEAVATDNYNGATTTGSEMIFTTGVGGSAAVTERLRMTDNGRFGFNTGFMGNTYNADLHFLSTNVNQAEVLVSAGNTGTGSDAIVYLAEDHDNSYSMSVLYDGGVNQLQIEGKSLGTTFPNLVTIDRNTGNTNFAGNVNVTGTLTKGGGTFKIDHPLDPENKFLSHSFVESPDMMNIYNGNVKTNASGEATVELPEYFDALNMEFRYQLTVMGTFAQAIVAEKIQGNTFVIKTDQPNVEVSWQVTGVRKDAWANENRVVPEVEKEEWQKGYYLHPEAHGEAPEKAMNYAPQPGINDNGSPVPVEVIEKIPIIGQDGAQEEKKLLDESEQVIQQQ